MKQDKNNQIDLLLRSLARGERSELPLAGDKLSAREDGVLSEHLDADELNSFAEGVAPAPARARYISHLADCESCRGFVIKLAQASGAAAGSGIIEQQTGAGFWRKMASLFSLPVLRYAVPALALTAVIGIAFFALRQQRSRELVALNQPISSEAQSSANDQPQSESRGAQSINEAPARNKTSVASRTQLDSSVDKKSFQDDRNSVAQSPAKTAEAGASTSSFGKDAPGSKQGYVAGADRPVFAPEPQAPPPPPKAGLSEADKLPEAQKEVLAKREVQDLSREEKNQPRDEVGRHGPSRSSTTVNGSRRADGLMTESAESKPKSKKDSEDEVETRTVSGKSFRRQGSTWIDSAYDSSRGTINVARASEQFRALVADEPAIGKIAEKLNGVIIVVWKGRAYRIQ